MQWIHQGIEVGMVVGRDCIYTLKACRNHAGQFGFHQNMRKAHHAATKQHGYLVLFCFVHLHLFQQHTLVFGKAEESICVSSVPAQNLEMLSMNKYVQGVRRGFISKIFCKPLTTSKVPSASILSGEN